MSEEKLIEQSYWTDFSLKKDIIVEKLIETFALRDDEFTPTILDGERFTKRRNIKYDKTMVDIFKNAILAPDVNYVVLTNSDKIKRDMLFGVRINMLNKFCVVSFSATHSYFSSLEKLKKFISIGLDVASFINPIYGCIHDIADLNNIMNGETFKVLEYIPTAFWGNYFGKHYVDKIGQQRIMSYKGHRVEELKNGGIYIQTTVQPLSPFSLQDRSAQRELAKLIGVK